MPSPSAGVGPQRGGNVWTGELLPVANFTRLGVNFQPIAVGVQEVNGATAASQDVFGLPSFRSVDHWTVDQLDAVRVKMG